MEGYLLVFLIAAALLVGAGGLTEHLSLQGGQAAPDVPPPVLRTTSTSPEFDAAVKAYRDNYVAYKATGRQAYKTAYTAAQAQIEKYIRDSEAKIDKDARYVKKFVTDYANANDKLTSYKNQAAAVRTEGPVIEGQYIVEKKLKEQPKVDLTPLYIKLGVAVLILGVGLVAVFLR